MPLVFGSELVDKVQQELTYVHGVLAHDIATDTFQGELVSQVRYQLY